MTRVRSHLINKVSVAGFWKKKLKTSESVRCPSCPLTFWALGLTEGKCSWRTNGSRQRDPLQFTNDLSLWVKKKKKRMLVASPSHARAKTQRAPGCTRCLLTTPVGAASCILFPHEYKESVVMCKDKQRPVSHTSCSTLHLSGSASSCRPLCVQVCLLVPLSPIQVSLLFHCASLSALQVRTHLPSALSLLWFLGLLAPLQWVWPTLSLPL